MKNLIIVIAAVCLIACKKSEGEGGTSTIKGKIYAIDMDNKFKDTVGTYYSGKEDVYIIYGDDDFYGDKIETHYDGSFEFNYLYEGNYKVYCYSEDTAGTNQLIPIIREVEITEKHQTVEVDEITIVK